MRYAGFGTVRPRAQIPGPDLPFPLSKAIGAPERGVFSCGPGTHTLMTTRTVCALIREPRIARRRPELLSDDDVASVTRMDVESGAHERQGAKSGRLIAGSVERGERVGHTDASGVRHADDLRVKRRDQTVGRRVLYVKRVVVGHDNNLGAR